MFLTMFCKTQNIEQTMHLTMLIAHPYLASKASLSPNFSTFPVSTPHFHSRILWRHNSQPSSISISINLNNIRQTSSMRAWVVFQSWAKVRPLSVSFLIRTSGNLTAKQARLAKVKLAKWCWKKVKWTYSEVYPSQTMLIHAKHGYIQRSPWLFRSIYNMLFEII